MQKRYKSLPLYLYHITVVLLIILLQSINIFAEVQNLVYDRFLSAREDVGKVVIVAITDKSLSELGAWPWDRKIFARVINNLDDAGAGVIGFDVVFAESRDNDANLKTAADSAKAKVIFPGKLINEDDYLRPIFASRPDVLSYVNFRADFDGKVRKADLTFGNQDECKLSFAYLVSKAYVNSKDFADCTKQELNVGFSKFKPEQQQIRINYVGSAGSFPVIDILDVYNGSLDKTLIKDKIILVGSTIQDLKSDLQDNFTNPFDGQIIAGVEVHANVVNTILENEFIYKADSNIEHFFLMLLAVVMVFVYRRINPIIAVVTSFLLIAAYLFIAAILFGSGLIVGVLQVPILLIAIWIGEYLWRYLLKIRENAEVKKAFGQYVNKDILNEILKDPAKLKLGGTGRVMSVLFSDIRGFTSISEKFEPAKLVHFLNIYLTEVTDVILKENGVVDKYIGDAVMALWGAPLENKLHSSDACKAALAMQKAVGKFNTNHSEEFTKLEIGIGINTGEMIVGNLGSSLRFDYSVIGDSVNLASRLEGLTKQYGAKILLGEDTIKHLKSTGSFDEFAIRHIDTVRVKGKKEPVKIYDLHEQVNSSLFEGYTAAFSIYAKGDFEKAAKQFQHLAKEYGDKTSLVMSERCKELSSDKADDWEGIWSWLTK